MPREELEAVFRARQELTSEHDDALMESFLAEVGAAIDRRVDERLAEVGPAKRRRQHSASVELAIASIALGIPVTAVAGSNAGSFGVACAWIGIVLLNLLYALSRRG